MSKKLLAVLLALAALLTLAAGCAEKTVFTSPDITLPTASADIDPTPDDIAPVVETYSAEVSALRGAIYNGDTSAMLRLFALSLQGAEIGADHDALQLAAAKFTDDYDVVASIYKNPLVRDYGEHEGPYDSFPAQRALQTGSAAVRRYDERAFLENDAIASNIDASRRYEPPNYKDFYSDFDDMWLDTWELDLDGDGKNELVYFSYGGTSGSGPWEIIHLDERGYIEYIDYGMDMMLLRMRYADGDYFFGRCSYDYDLDYQNGLRLFAMDADGVLWQADITREFVGLRATLSDVFDESLRPLYDEISEDLETYFERYAQMELTNDGFSVGRTLPPDDDIVELFEDIHYYETYAERACGKFDLNNDGTDEIIGEIRYWDYGIDQMMYEIFALASGSDEFAELNPALVPPLSDFDYATVLQAFPVAYNGKNYVLSLHPFGDAQYIFRLNELATDARGNYTATVHAAWLTTIDYLTCTTVSEW